MARASIIEQTDNFRNLQDERTLPFEDLSVFLSGFLTNSDGTSGLLGDRRWSQEELDDNLKYIVGRKSVHFTGETLLNVSGHISGSFSLNDAGSMVITLSGPGFENRNSRTQFTESLNTPGVWEKLQIKDELTIGPDFTWKRRKEIEPDFFIIWKGNYSFSGKLIVFSLEEQGFDAPDGFSEMTAQTIPHYGIMYGPVPFISGIVSGYFDDDNDTVILNSFMDDGFTDQIHTYTLLGPFRPMPKGWTIDGVSDTAASGFKNSVHQFGGRGELAKYFVFNGNFQDTITWEAGRWGSEDIPSVNTTVSVSAHNLDSISGLLDETADGNSFFGGIGGNVIFDNFNLCKANTPDHGHIKITYGSPNYGLVDNLNQIPNSIPNLFRILEINSSGIEVLPDKPAITSETVVKNRMLVNNETEVFYRIKDRSKELCLSGSYLNGKPLNEYNVIYGEPGFDFDANSTTFNENEQLRRTVYGNNEIYIYKLDNHVFLTPFRRSAALEGDPRVIPLELNITNRKFYFAIARDNQIESVSIRDIIFNPDDADEDGVYRTKKERDADGNIILY